MWDRLFFVPEFDVGAFEALEDFSILEVLSHLCGISWLEV